MANFWKSNVLLMSISLCLLATVSIWTLEKNSCFQITIQEKISMKVGLCEG